jgi:hypothetical protein
MYFPVVCIGILGKRLQSDISQMPVLFLWLWGWLWALGFIFTTAYRTGLFLEAGPDIRKVPTPSNSRTRTAMAANSGLRSRKR